MYKTTRNRFYLQNKGKTIVGCAFWISGTDAHLFNFSVNEEKRGKGIGEKFLIELFLYLKTRGIKRITLNVLKENLVARNLYRKLGFRKTSEENRIITMAMEV